MNNFYFDKTISITLYKTKMVEGTGHRIIDYDSKLEIKTTSSGLKPDIDFEIKMLLGQNCYDATVKVRNCMRLPDIRSYDFMDIKAGYKYSNFSTSEKTTTFSIAIFTAYQESPNPDGTTVFRGLTVGQIGGLLTTRPISFTSHREMPVWEFIQAVAYGASGFIDSGHYDQVRVLGPDPGVLTVNSKLPTALKGLKVPPQTRIANNGPALLAWAYDLLYEMFKGVGYTYVQQIYNGSLFVGVLEASEQLKTTERVVNICSVYSASFTAQILNLSAPWDPLITPGTIVRVNANYYTAGVTPQDMDIMSVAQPAGLVTAKEAADGVGLYRVLTSNLQFSTCQDANKMDLVLVPITYMQSNPDTDVGIDIYTHMANVVSTVSETSDPVNIVIGEQLADTSTQNIWGKKLKGTYAIKTNTLLVGTTFSQLGLQYYDSDSGHSEGASLWLSRSTYNKDYVVDIAADGSLVYGKNPDIKVGVLSGKCNAWPIILQATYAAYKAGDTAAKVDIDDPDTLPAGTRVYVPELSDTKDAAINQLKPDKELFKAMGDYYKARIGTYKTWAKDTAIRMYNMYLVLGGTL